MKVKRSWRIEAVQRHLFQKADRLLVLLMLIGKVAGSYEQAVAKVFPACRLFLRLQHRHCDPQGNQRAGGIQIFPGIIGRQIEIANRGPVPRFHFSKDAPGLVRLAVQPGLFRLLIKLPLVPVAQIDTQAARLPELFQACPDISRQIR